MIKGAELMAGAAAEGDGALAGWNGKGTLTHPMILSALARAGLSAELAPKIKTAIAHAGEALRKLDSRGYVVRRGKRPTHGVSRWDARWVVGRSMATEAMVNDKMGDVVLTAELWGEELRFECGPGGATLAEKVDLDFRALRADRVYQAADVTSWLQGVLYRECGATPLGRELYVPARGRVMAEALTEQMAAIWGEAWMSPLLPVATCDQLRRGVARGMHDEVRTIGASLASARESARAEGRTEVTTGTASRFLAQLEAIRDRMTSYVALCGAAVLEATSSAIGALSAELRPLCDVTSQRFAAMDLTGPVQTTPAQNMRGSAIRAADRALEERRAMLRAPAVPAPGPTAPAPVEEHQSDTAIRASLLEWD